MSKGIFEQVEQYSESLKCLKLSFNGSLREVEEILGAIEARIEAEKEADAEREMAGVDLEVMKGRTYGPTETERVAFESAVADAGDAIIGLHELSVNMSVAAHEIKTTLDELAGKLAACPAVCDAQINMAVERFKRLCVGEGGDGK